MKKDKKPVFLIGFMGSGKTTVGKALAKRLGCRLIDTDREVVKKSGRSIASIFKNQGETVFRNQESDAITRACRAGSAVVAVGGGGVIRKRNVSAMRSAGTVVYLQAPLKLLARRVGAGASRPLWKNADSLFRTRVSLYNSAAHIRIRAGEGTPSLVAERVARRLG